MQSGHQHSIAYSSGAVRRLVTRMLDKDDKDTNNALHITVARDGDYTYQDVLLAITTTPAREPHIAFGILHDRPMWSSAYSFVAGHDQAIHKEVLGDKVSSVCWIAGRNTHIESVSTCYAHQEGTFISRGLRIVDLGLLWATWQVAVLKYQDINKWKMPLL